MSLSEQQTKSLVDSIVSAETDELDCDDCFASMAEFVENELAGREVPDAMQRVKRHLDQCPCCKDEFNALLEALLVFE